MAFGLDERHVAGEAAFRDAAREQDERARSEHRAVYIELKKAEARALLAALEEGA